MCFTPACWARITPWCITTQHRDRKGKIRLDAQGNPQIENWLFAPTPKQVEFFEQALRTKYTLFGGAKAVAKSYALRWMAYYMCLKIPNLRVLLLRRTYSELETSHLLEMPGDAEKLKPVGANYTSGAREFWFGNGSLIKAGHCESEADVSKFLSSQWDIIIFDEIVTFLHAMFLAIASCARTTKEAVLQFFGGARIWAATNPGGRGALWVHEWFISHDVERDKYPKYQPEQWGMVPGRVDDNPYMEEGYKASLENLPPMLRRQWLHGDWFAFEGQFFGWEASRDGQPWHERDLRIAA